MNNNAEQQKNQLNKTITMAQNSDNGQIHSVSVDLSAGFSRELVYQFEIPANTAPALVTRATASTINPALIPPLALDALPAAAKMCALFGLLRLDANRLLVNGECQRIPTPAEYLEFVGLCKTYPDISQGFTHSAATKDLANLCYTCPYMQATGQTSSCDLLTVDCHCNAFSAPAPVCPIHCKQVPPASAKTILYPHDRVTNKTFTQSATCQTVSTEIQDLIPVRTSPNHAAIETGVLYGLTAPDKIPPEMLADLPPGVTTFNGTLDHYDRIIYSCIGSLLEGNDCFTINDLCKLLKDEHPNEDDLLDIKRRIDKMRYIGLRLTNTPELQAGYNYPSFSAECYLLPLRKVWGKSTNGKEVCYYELSDTKTRLPLIEFARGRKQMAFLPPTFFRKAPIALKPKAQRLDYLTNLITTDTANLSRRWKDEGRNKGLYSEFNIVKNRARFRDEVKDLLEHLKEQGIITDYACTDEGITWKRDLPKKRGRPKKNA